jgi:hypothetical protein
MASDLRIRVGTATGTITFGGTDTQIAAALRRYASSLGISVEGTAVENLTAILEHIRDDVKRISKQVQASELRSSNEAQIQQTVESENSL